MPDMCRAWQRPDCRVTHQSVCQAFENPVRQQLDPEGLKQQAKAAQDRLVAKFGGRGKALIIGTQGANPVPDK